MVCLDLVAHAQVHTGRVTSDGVCFWMTHLSSVDHVQEGQAWGGGGMFMVTRLGLAVHEGGIGVVLVFLLQ